MDANDCSNADAAPVQPVKAPTGPFEHLPDALPVLKDYETRQKLLQWNLSDTLQLQRFLVHRRLPSEADEALLTEFFQDDTVHRILPLPAGLGSNSSNDKHEHCSMGASSLHLERLHVSVTTMAFFEKLESAGVTARDGSIRGCIDEDFDGCTAGDLLTEMLANADSANGDVFSDDERQEFIFQLFSALVVGGGALRQADARVQAYESATRALYRALVSVKKSIADANGKRDIEVTSRVYRVSGDALFQASPSRFHSCFAVVDARKRWLTFPSPFPLVENTSLSIATRYKAMMERVPIRLGSLRTTVKPPDNASAAPLLSEGPSVTNASLARVCRVCTAREARYTCPRCNAPYCSVDCYRDHGEGCTEQFFEGHVRSEMQLASNARGDNGKQQQKSIQELLERVREFQEEQQRVADGEDDEEALMQRMQELELLDKAGELTLDSLTPEERKKFLGEVADGRLGKLVEIWSPWWLMSERKYRSETSARRRQLILEEVGGDSEEEKEEAEAEVSLSSSVMLEPTVLYPVALFTNSDSLEMPGSMSSLLPGGRQPSSCLRYHLVEVLFAYVLVLRVFNGDYAQDIAEAALMLLDLCRVLSEDARYESLEHVCLACLEKRSSERSAAKARAIRDAQQILRTDVFLLDALSDTRALVERYQQELERSSESDKHARKERKAALRRLAAVQKKLAFYQTWAYLTPTVEFQSLAAEVETNMKDKELIL
ncbi:Zinc finger HIT domain-containing protein 2 [Phytophthora pseudosyringae]|uniref:Zinc finger HIT domain-containing protein 2 n=1 Tax=Phytophthora pseudosyringae TaxID=221518 RepID=A0A8T1VQS7_9STRA|nr:Zinc finger HIT domain-containing protein 2 [Phytophthora pseudosyringae]